MNPVRQRRLGHLMLATNEIVGEIETWIRYTDKKKMSLRFKPLDQVRLLKLKVWAEKNHIAVAMVLDLIVPELRKFMTGKNTNAALGISVPTLTGRAAYRILERQLSREFPDSEHESVWLEDLKTSQLNMEQAELFGGKLPPSAEYASILDAPSVEQYIESYDRAVDAAKELRDNAERQRWRKRKQYRGNPWR